ncbi:DUF5615 family PIN-like protein [Gloeobacter morelensis]|uniref:DUF5615 family PIN-like protein n=1 Tax=Gloeobacter morelensis MG652769 TaxID=2781736 RepID=A0ABY3PPP3_9CYAN|nr:DUF5615 family PIN-like protein [Gloeobacter morelensis]UFP95668.1 DUF5615 family PIN-like protein [Gloeobacter morelensis MG652769]
MSLRLLIDEDTQAWRLVELLRAAGHDVLTPQEAGLIGKPDAIVFEYAITTRRTLLTHNCSDFFRLHQANPSHLGILAIYRDADPQKQMSRPAIVRAIANLEELGIDLQQQFYALNHYNW